jgi:hypothetical protein
LSSNPDAYISSVYGYVLPEDGLLRLGPAWDFDLCCAAEPGPLQGYLQGWRFETIYGEGSSAQDPAEYSILIPALRVWWLGHPDTKVSTFRAALATRWKTLRSNVWSDDSLRRVVEASARAVSGEVERNARRWDPTKEIETSLSLRAYRGRWETEVQALADFLVERARWMDGALGGGEDEIQETPEISPTSTILPWFGRTWPRGWVRPA